MNMTKNELIRWAVNEIRELDELCRSMVPGYEPLTSVDMEALARLEAEASGAGEEYVESRERKLREAAEENLKRLDRALKAVLGTLKDERDRIMEGHRED